MTKHLDVHMQKQKLTWVTSYLELSNIDHIFKKKNYKILKENIGECLHKFRFGDKFLDIITKAQFMNKKTGKLDIIKI